MDRTNLWFVQNLEFSKTRILENIHQKTSKVKNQFYIGSLLKFLTGQPKYLFKDYLFGEVTKLGWLP